MEKEIVNRVAQSKLITFMTILCAIISLIGLIGLTAFNIDQRRKEIGIRKVLGAMSPQIVRLMYSGTFKLLLIASFIAIPLAYLGINKWSQNFEYQTGVNVGLIVLGVGTVLLLTFLLVSTLVFNSAQKNPANTLRQD